jgi:chorismate dehydratase
MLRVGQIDYANCTPVFMQLEDKLPDDLVEIVHGVPAELNAKLALGEIDICISSSIEFCRYADKYAILPGHCIGSDGPVKSVMLFTNQPVEELSNQQIIVTAESATSVIMLKILLAKHWGVKNCTVSSSDLPWKQALEDAPGLLLIGDKALQAAAASAGSYCYDLGEEWQRFSGLPFVYALWLINSKAAKGKEQALYMLGEQLEQVRQRIVPDAVQLASRAREAAWLGQSALVDYWQKAIKYRLDDDYLAGLKLFYQLAAELEFVEQAPELKFFK